MVQTIISELPCEKLVRKVIGDQWRSLPEREQDGAWGVAIVKSIIDGVRPELYEIASHLGVEKTLLWRANRRLTMNGIFRGNKLESDRSLLEAEDVFTWCYYAGYASGFTGPWAANDDSKRGKRWTRRTY